jgi:RHS repeat-associated protein
MSPKLEFGYPATNTTTIKETVIGRTGGNVVRTTTHIFNPGGSLNKEVDAQGNEIRYTYDGNGDQTRTELWEKQSNGTLALLKAVDSTYNGQSQKLTESVTLDTGEVITSTMTYNNGWLASRQTVSSTSPQIFKVEYGFLLAQTKPAAINQVRMRKDDGTYATTNLTYCSGIDVSDPNALCPDKRLIKQVDGPRTDVNDIVTIRYYATTDTSGCGTSTGNCYHLGDRKEIENALGQKIEFLRYDGAGRATKIRDANGVVAELVYHPRGWLLQQIVRGPDDAVTTDDQITTNTFDARGNLTHLVTPDGRYADLTWNDRDWLLTARDQDGNELRYTYDSSGNRLTDKAYTSANVLKRTESMELDVLDRVTKVIGSLSAINTQMAYDAAGRQTKVTDANAVQGTATYDDLDRLIATVSDSTAGGILSTTGMAYDAVGNLRGVVDPKGLATTYVYDALSRLTQQNSPDSGTTNYTWDDAGNLKTKTDARSITATYAYDALNRPVSVTYPTAAENVSYAYDAVNAVCTSGETFAVGHLTKMTDQSGTTEYCYDRFGNLARKVQTTGGVAHVVRYAYTASNTLASTTYPDGTLVDYVRDNENRVKEVGVTLSGGARQVLVKNAAYLPAGPASSWQYGNNRTLTRNYDQNYRATTVYDSGPNTSTTASGQLDDGLNIGYVYDNASYLKEVRAESLSSTTTRAKFDYDALGRLLDRKNSGNVIQESYTYDGTGNRLSATAGTTTTSYTYPATNHRLTQVGATVRGYDVVGNLTAIGGTAREYGYNDANRMSLAKAGGVLQATYLYNGFGEQVQRQTSVTTRFVYDEAGNLLGQYDNTGAPIQEYIWMEGVPVGVLNGTTLRYVEADQLGTPRAVVDPTQQKAVWRWDESGEGFGNGAPNTDPDGDGTQFVFDLRFPGQRYDAASGLYYNRMRDYDPSVGRYTQSDPIGLAGGLSTYAYALGNPTGLTDPSGNFVFLIPVAFAIWEVIDLSLTAYDIYNTVQTFKNPCATDSEKWTAVALTLAGVALPIGGLTVIPKIASKLKFGERFAKVLKRIPCRNSFDEDTLVQTDKGMVRIADVRVGDKVLARNELTGEESYQTVTATMVEWHDTTLTIELWRADDSEEIVTTDEHPFYVVGKGFTRAVDLALGDIVQLSGGGISVVGIVKRNFKGQLAYNLSVANDHTYFVGQSHAWVHNSECGSGLFSGKNFDANVRTVRDAIGKGNNITVSTQREAEEILARARPEIPWQETYGPKVKVGAEVHPVDGSGNAPGFDYELPHIKWRDWTAGKGGGAEGHIYFESVNGQW